MPPDFAVEVDAAAGIAVVTMPLLGALTGIPQCLLSGGAHATPITPTAANATGLATVELTFSEAVAPGDLLTWPDKDQAIRSRTGSYVTPQTFTIGGSAPTSPTPITSSYDAFTQQMTATYDQAVTAPGPSAAGAIILQTTDGVTMVSGAILSIAGPVVVFSMLLNAPLALANGTANSTGMGAVLVGTVGGLPSNDMAGLACPQNAYTQGPIPLGATNIGGNKIRLSWNVEVTDNASTNSLHYSDPGFNLFDNAGPTYVVSTVITQGDCTNALGASGVETKITIDVAVVTSPESGVDNDQYVDFPCP